VHTTQNMFYGAESFLQDLTNWDFSHIDITNDMFKCTKYSNGDYDHLLPYPIKVIEENRFEFPI